MRILHPTFKNRNEFEKTKNSEKRNDTVIIEFPGNAYRKPELN